MKKILFLVLCVVCFGSAMAQENEYQAQYSKLYKDYIKDPNEVVNLILMCDFYCDQQNPMRSLPLAMKYISSAESNYIAIIEDNSRYPEARRLVKRKITINTVRDKKANVINEAYAYITTSDDLSDAELDNYAKAFAEDVQILRSIEKRRIRAALNEAKRENTITSYSNFQAKYPGTNEAEEAEKCVMQLASTIFCNAHTEAEINKMAAPYKDNPSVMRAANRQRAHLAYVQACKLNTIKAYSDYIRQYPSGDDYVEALDRIDHLMEVQYSSLSTPQEYVDFISANVENPLAEQAMEQLRKMIVNNHDVSAAKLYLKNFPLDDAYSNIYSLYYSWHSAEGNSNPIVVFDTANPHFPFKTVLARDLEAAQEYDQIYLLEPFDNANIEIYAGYIRKLTGKGLSFVALQRTLQQLIHQKNWNAASTRMGDYLLSFDENPYQAPFTELRGLLTAPVKNQNALSTEARPGYEMLNPTMHPNGRFLYYTRRVGIINTICYAQYTGAKTSKWKMVGEVKFSNIQNKNLTFYCLYNDGNKMLLGKSGDILSATLNGDTWTVDETFPAPVNTPYIETDAFMLPDGSGMLLASDREGGYNLQKSGSYFHGDTAMATDIYFIPRTKTGWGQPINLGPNVNTSYCERSPILSRNLRTLYFVTDGRGGLGYGDVYMCTRSNMSDWTSWSAPVNLGKEVNSGYRESSVSLSPDEKRLLISSNAGGGRHACYSTIAQHDVGASYSTVTLDGSLLSEGLSQLLIVDVTSQSVNRSIDISNIDNVELKLPSEHQYAVCAEVTGCFAPALLFKPGKTSMVLPVAYTTSQLTSMSQTLALDLVDFEPGTSKLLPLALQELRQVAHYMKSSLQVVAEITINVAGSDDAECYDLSLERGKTIKKWLTTAGVDAYRISISAFGNINAKGGKSVVGTAIRFRSK